MPTVLNCFWLKNYPSKFIRSPRSKWVKTELTSTEVAQQEHIHKTVECSGNQTGHEQHCKTTAASVVCHPPTLFDSYNDFFFIVTIFIGLTSVKGIVHFEINVLYVLAYLKGIQDVGVCFHSIFYFDIFQLNRCCLSVIHWRLRGSTKKHAN